MAIHIGNNTFPDELAGKAGYMPPDTRAMGANGNGVERESTLMYASWDWRSVSVANVVWLRDTLFGGKKSAVYSSSRLYDFDASEIDYGTTRVRRLVTGQIIQNHYETVSIQIEIEP